MFSNKRGISPLIATVLIIGFTVALAAVIMVWGQGFIKDMQSKTQAESDIQLSCAQDVKLEVSDACRESGDANLKVTVKNDGNKDLTSLTLRAYESSSKIASTSDTGALGSLAAFGVKTFTIPSALLTGGTTGITTLASLKQVEIIPHITVSGKDTTCPQSGSSFPIGALPTTVLSVCAP